MNIMDLIKRKHILVIGDVMIDIYYEGDIKRISPEAPVPVFLKKAERNVLGGAANVAANLLGAGQNVSIMSVIGNDGNAENLIYLLHELKIDTSYILRTDRRTTSKTRFIAGNNQQVIRLDEEDIFPISNEICVEFLDALKENISKFDLIVLSDYMKGLLTYEFTQGVIRIAAENNVKVITDVKDTNIKKYSGSFILKPNQSELRQLTDLPVDSDEEIIAASNYLVKETECNYVLTTCGAKGMRLVSQDSFLSVNSVGKEVFDVTGAGDTVIAYIAACTASGLELKNAMEIASCAAGLQVSKPGTSIVRLKEVDDFIAKERNSPVNKIIDMNSLNNLRKINNDKRFVFTNGCFDILHIGHIRCLQEAAKLGDILIVGLNSDNSIRRIKGDDRPVNCQMDRAELLCALECVDKVVIFEEDTPYELIKMLQPDILVKGGDYTPNDVVGKDIVEGIGGKVEILPFVEGRSTTMTIKHIKETVLQ